MTLQEIKDAMICYTKTVEGNAPNCFMCNKRDFCDDLTRAILKHITKEKVKSNAKIQEKSLI